MYNAQLEENNKEQNDTGSLVSRCKYLNFSGYKPLVLHVCHRSEMIMTV